MAETQVVRRQFLHQSLRCLAGALVLPLLTGCGKGRDSRPGIAEQSGCDVTPDMSTSELSLRESLRYMHVSPHGEERNCSNCYFLVAAVSDDACGECKTVKGPISPQGYCVAWTGHGA